MIYITGDTHGDMNRIVRFGERMETSQEDIMIILGDVDLNYYGDSRDRRNKEKVANLPITLFCIHGNHERRPTTIVEYKLQEWNGGKVWVEEAYPNILFAKDGEIYDIAGMKTIVISGAYSVDKFYRLSKGYNWFEDEQPSDEIKAYVEKQLSNNDWNVDVVLSHTVPYDYRPVDLLLAKETFGKKTIRSVKTSDAKLFLIKLQQEDGKSYSSIHTIRGVLRPAFQMAVDDDILVKNPFGFQLAGVLVNDAVTREAISKDQMRKFLKFVHDDVVYCKYYEVVYILFHTGMRIPEFCGLTLKDIDLENRTINIDHQLQRTSDMRYIIETTKTDAGTEYYQSRRMWHRCFRQSLRIEIHRKWRKP